MSTIKSSTITALCMSLCAVLPYALHAIPNAGSIFCPIHIPILLCGIICGWRYGLLCGLVGPLLSSQLSGMPSPALLPAMMVECCAYGVIAGLGMKFIHTKSTYTDLYVSLITAMLTGRILAGLFRGFIFSRGAFMITTWVTGYFVTSIPGIITQIVLLPTIVFALMRARLISERYPAARKELER